MEVSSKLTKAPLENEGNIGSRGAHFEQVTFGPELMVSQINKNPKITKMSLAVAKDSGFYVVDMLKGENYLWGKNEGCDMFGVTCSNENITEFCEAKNTNTCSDNHMYRTRCKKTTFNATCPIYFYQESCKQIKTSNRPQYTFGKESVCLFTEVKIEFMSEVVKLKIK